MFCLFIKISVNERVDWYYMTLPEPVGPINRTLLLSCTVESSSALVSRFDINSISGIKTLPLLFSMASVGGFNQARLCAPTQNKYEYKK